MNYCQQYFQKDINDLEYQDIEEYFVEDHEETTYIEYKSYSTQNGSFNSQFKGILRTICALLNSDGGIIVCGAPIGRNIEGRDEKVFTGALSPVNEEKGKDSIINKISDSIYPLPVGVELKILSDSDNYLYIFEVQKSNYRPHQYQDKYYVRLDAQTRPAPHYLVESLFKEIRFPNLEGYLKIHSISSANTTEYFLKISVFIFNFSGLQNEESLSYSLITDKGQFHDSQYQANPLNYLWEGHMYKRDNVLPVFYYGSPYTITKTIVIPKSTSQVRLILTFGGKKSPMKSSKYIIDLSSYSESESINYFSLFTNIEENQLMANQQPEGNRTREDVLKEMLGR